MALALTAPAAAASQDTEEEVESRAAEQATAARRRVVGWIVELGGPRSGAAREELEQEIVVGFLARAVGCVDADRREALLWAAAALRGDAPEWLDRLRALGREVSAEGSATTMMSQLAAVAEAAFAAGRLDVAERLVGCALTIGTRDAWTAVQYLWYLRSEIARKAGRSDEVERSLNSLGLSLHADAALESHPELRAYNLDSRARYHLGRTRMLLEAGLLEQARDELDAGRDAAGRSGFAITRAYAESVALEVAMMRQSSQAVVRISEELAAAPWIGELPESHLTLFRAIEGSCWAELERLWILGIEEPEGSLELAESRARALLTAALESGHLGVPDQVVLLTLLAEGALLRGEPEIALGHLDACGRLAAPSKGTGFALRDDALAAALRWRALRALQPDGAAHDEKLVAAFADLRAAFEHLLAQWGTVPARAGGVGFLHLEWRTYLLATMIDATLDRYAGDRPVERAFECLLASQAMGSVARKRGLESPSLDAVRDALLGGDRMLLVLAPGRGGSHLFVLTEGSIECHSVAPGARLLQLAEPVLRDLSPAPGRRPATDRQRAALRDELLPAPVRKRIERAREVYVHGFDRLRGLPFAFLPDSEGRPLGARIAVSEIPSVPVAVERARATRDDARDVLFVAAPGSRGLALDGLPFGAAERRQLTAAFDPERVRFHLGDGATPAALLADGALDGVAVLFVLAHTLPDEAREGSAKLVLADPASGGAAFVDADDLRALRFRGVAVLASCEAARGPSRIGDDALAHLGGALLESGALAVVVARERVAYRPTLELLERTLAGLAAGASTAAALRDAFAAMLGDDPWSAVPDCGFQVLGLGFEPALPR